MQSSTRRLLGTTSVVALSAAAMIGMAEPAKAQSSAPNGVFLGGSTLASQLFRQIFDCYTGANIAKSGTTDGFTFTSSFPATYTAAPQPGALPTTCTAATITTVGGFVTTVEGLYAGVGSGNGFRGYIAHNADQWYGGTVAPGGSNTTINTPVPAAAPPYIDTSNTGTNSSTFGAYPYPNVDVGLSDAPLPSTLAGITTTSVTFSPANGWQTTTQITLGSTVTTQTYSTGSYGQPIQIPALEVPVAIAINTATTTAGTWSINSTSGLSGAGSAIQLTAGQLCAIFSGTVTDWHSTASIRYLANSTVSTTPTAAFDYANTINGSGLGHGTGATPYFSASLPITVVYRSDGSGTSFIITNYLASVCPLMDDGSNHYQQIFAPSSTDISNGYLPLPNTNFSNLTHNIAKAGNSTSGWLGETGSSGVADTIGNASAGAGRIGYVSIDFTSPFSSRSNPPVSASLQNQNERVNGSNVPGGATAVDGGNFIAPTADGAANAWSALAVPATTSTYNAWNVYGQLYASGTVLNGDHVTLTVGQRSILPLTPNAAAYPLTGTTFLALYSCYNDSTSPYVRGQPLLDFLNWYVGNNAGGVDITPIRILRNNGFHELNAQWLGNIANAYLSPGSGSGQNIDLLNNTIGGDGCSGVTGSGG
jgi:ABC-type phosphate transport system substrate-binding protein